MSEDSSDYLSIIEILRDCYDAENEALRITVVA